MGCGLNKLPGYTNVDKYAYCSPDLMLDLEQAPWDIPSDTASEVIFNHCLEHLGQQTDVFLNIMKELYRICQPDALVKINVPHPRHDHFIGDPTHVRIITPLVLSLFSKKNCLHWQEIKAANSPLALYLDIDFETVSVTQVPDNFYTEKLKSGEIKNEDLYELAKNNNNVIKEFRILLKAIKQ